MPVEAARRVGAIPGAAALEASQDRLVEKQLFRRLGIPTVADRRRGGGVPGAPEDAPARLRRKGPASGGDTSGARPRPRPGGTCLFRPRAVAARRARRATATRASGRSSRTCTRTGSCAPRARPRRDAPQAEAEEYAHAAPRRARLRRRAGARALRRRRRAARERVRAARPQHRPLDDRGRRDEPVREPPARDPRPAARLDRVAAVAAREPDRLGAARRGRAARSPARTSTSTARSRGRAASSATSRSSSRPSASASRALSEELAAARRAARLRRVSARGRRGPSMRRPHDGQVRRRRLSSSACFFSPEKNIV